MNSKLLKVKEKEAINKFIASLFFVIIFVYYLNYPSESSKGYLLIRGTEGVLRLEYGFWGYLNDISYKFIDFISGDLITGNFLMELIFAFQISLIYAVNVYKINKITNYYTVFILLNPFILNFFCRGTRDAIALGILLLLSYDNWNKLRLLLTIITSFCVHKGILPLTFLFSLIHRNKEKSKTYFFALTIISILLAIIFHTLLRYTDFADLIPNGFYREILKFPRLAYTDEATLLSKIENLIIGKTYNFYGSFNLKILFFGIIGQIASIFFKYKLPNNTFPLCFTSFFICSILSSVPNADRFIYHSTIISSPFLLNYFCKFLKDFYKRKFQVSSN